MRSKRMWLAGCIMLVTMLCCLSCGEKAEDTEAAKKAETLAYTEADTLHWDLFVSYLQEHFDDFHDVTMRYHHKDHTINGVIEIRMTWEDGLLQSAEAVSNETGSDDLPASLIEKMRGWEIAGLDGPAEITVPVNVKIVGLDDPEFTNTAILTGEIRDAQGNPLPGVKVLIKPEVAGMVYRAETNREGIFVRTLIPPGTWHLEYSLQGYEPAVKAGITLSAGQHIREKVALKKK